MMQSWKLPAIPTLVLSMLFLSAVPTQAMSATEVARLGAPDFESFSEFPSSTFGESISLDGDSVLIGDSDDSEAGESAGAAYIYTRTDGVWRLEQKILAPDATEDDNFGESVALEGDTALIGAIRDDELGFRSGSAYVYTRTNGVWTLQQKLLAADGKTDDVFGRSVALDGDTALIGTLSGGDGDNILSSTGSVYVFTRSDGVWTEQQELTSSGAVVLGSFGSSVALDNDTALIGASGRRNFARFPGAAYVFTRSDGVWSQQQALLPADGRSAFGGSVALESKTALISGLVFTRSDDAWSETQKLEAPEESEGDFFGESVALDGDNALIGAPFDSDVDLFSGAFYLFTRTGDGWVRQRKIVASDGSFDDQFGNSVALDGDTAIAGAPKGNVEGTVYIYDLSAIGTEVDDDEDGIPDTEDNCPAQFNPLQEDFDGDRSGDACDTDDDNDNVPDDNDNCPLIINADQANFDNDSAGDICDEDDDNDGVPDLLDVNPFDPNVGTGIEVTVSRSILSSQDDVELRGNGRVAVDSNDLELGLDEGFEGINTVVFLRFADLAIPQGAIIRDARVLFWVDEPTEEFSTLTLQGLIEADGRPSRNGVPFGPQTNTIVDWSPPPWTTRGTAPVEQTQTPDLSAIVQEVVNGSGWQAGNPLSLFIRGSGRRVAYSYDQLSGLRAPMLTVRYYTEEGNEAPSVELGSDIDVLQSDSLTLKGQVQDDGLPLSPGTTSVKWSKLSGPGTVDFDDPDSATTTMTFSRNGRYELELRAFDGVLTGLDRIVITVTGEIAENVVERRIASSNDDAEEELTRTGGEGPVNLGSSDLELPFESTEQAIGLRFTDLAIPAGATITRAWIQFTVDETRLNNQAPISLTIHGENTADARSFEETIGNLSSRPLTETSVSWSPPQWERIDDVEDAQRTPDLSAIIEEIVDEANGWQSGNALVLLIGDTLPNPNRNGIGIGQRVAESFDGERNSAPLLHVEYE